MSFDRQEKALREFKKIMADLVHLVRTSSRVELAYICWVNHDRQQFVWESNSTNLKNVMFKDRVPFNQHFLDEYKEIKEIVQLNIGTDISKAKLAHYFGFVNAKHIFIIPFINKGKTVALTVLESENPIQLQELSSQIRAYNNAMVNVLDTYSEVVNLLEQQNEWQNYENALNTLDYRLHRVDLLSKMLDEMQLFLPHGGAFLVAQTMEGWSNVLTSKFSKNAPNIGLMMDDKSSAHDAIEKGVPVFKIHFNNNPKLISNKEGRTEGASFSMPLMIHDRRHAVVVTYDADQLTFKESIKHKLANLARIASLAIQSASKKSDINKHILTENYGAIMTELWEKTLENEIKSSQVYKNKNIWFGFITIDDLPTLRTKYGSEALKGIQKDIVTFLNPAKHGTPGYIGFNSDYVYAFIIQSNIEFAVAYWMDRVRTKLAHGLKLSAGGTLDVRFKASFTEVSKIHNNAYELITKTKKALNKVMKTDRVELIEVE